ncbi:MAG: triphosphoribosyl-dephospho-CoA synthase [Planctomycetota bacterium]
MATRWPITSVSDAIRWACVLEATAPKLGNVHPSASFDDLRYEHFAIAARITAEELTEYSHPIGKRISQTVEQTRLQCGTNVNLGIVLLLGPLVESYRKNPWSSLPQRISLEGIFDIDDSQVIFQAIATAGAGGLGNKEQLDVRTPPPDLHLTEAMKHAAGRDDVALQYTTEFDRVCTAITPKLIEETKQLGMLEGIAETQRWMLAEYADTLISRKHDANVAKRIQQKAQQLDSLELDALLRGDGNQYNPGTTADLLAASIFVMLAGMIPETR